MPKPKLYRDPIHDQISYRATGKVAYASLSPTAIDDQLGWAVHRILDTPEFQRLRHVRQNGFANLVFHGMEHSRFCHSMGVAHVAKTMYEGVCRNSDVAQDQTKLDTCIAALVHDVGHGPFSHTLEDVLETFPEIKFSHEIMSQRIISETDSAICRTLTEMDGALPGRIKAFFDKTTKPDRKWYHKIVSSQLDADRLDYVRRDAMSAGLRGHAADVSRITETLFRVDDRQFGVDSRSFTAVEGFLVTLDELYRAVYFHPTIRSANVMLKLILRRAFTLFKDGDTNIFPALPGHDRHPLAELCRLGHTLPLALYTRLSDYHLWTLIEGWQFHRDEILKLLAARLMNRSLFKWVDMRSQSDMKRQITGIEAAKAALRRHFGFLTDQTVDFMLDIDTAKRVSYKRPDFRSEGNDESIWIIPNTGTPYTIDDDIRSSSDIVHALKRRITLERLVVPAGIRADIATYFLPG